jgi:ribosomal RNA-processing protein 12
MYFYELVIHKSTDSFFLYFSSSKSEAAKNLPEHLFDQLEDEPLDLLDRQKTMLSLRSKHLKRKVDLDEPELDSEGRLIIRDGEEPKKETPSDPDLDAKSEAGNHLSVNSRRNQKRRKLADSGGWAYTGSEYSSKKAGGDVKRKDKLEPYAYWPLDRKMRKVMAGVVKMTKKLEGKSASIALSSKGLKFKRSQKKKGSKK